MRAERAPWLIAGPDHGRVRRHQRAQFVAGPVITARTASMASGLSLIARRGPGRRVARETWRARQVARRPFVPARRRGSDHRRRRGVREPDPARRRATARCRYDVPAGKTAVPGGAGRFHVLDGSESRQGTSPLVGAGGAPDRAERHVPAERERDDVDPRRLEVLPCEQTSSRCACRLSRSDSAVGDPSDESKPAVSIDGEPPSPARHGAARGAPDRR